MKACESVTYKILFFNRLTRDANFSGWLKPKTNLRKQLDRLQHTTHTNARKKILYNAKIYYNTSMVLEPKRKKVSRLIICELGSMYDKTGTLKRHSRYTESKKEHKQPRVN